MKKIITTLAVLAIITPVFAEVFFEPEWSEFCPKKYENISTDKWYYTASARYWSARRKKFEQRLERCKQAPEEAQDACFNSLRDIEFDLTRTYTTQNSSNALKYMMINSMF